MFPSEAWAGQTPLCRVVCKCWDSTTGVWGKRQEGGGWAGRKARQIGEQGHSLWFLVSEKG